MQAHYVEFSPAGAGFESPDGFAFSGRHVEVRHIAGAGDAEISFDGATVHGKVSATGGTYPTSLLWREQDGVSRVWIRGASETVAIRAWI